MPLNKNIKKVLVIGSGPIVIGQAAEFDYAGAQACRVLKDEGIEVVLVNSNPATIMTDKALADHIYLEPLTEETVKRIIEKERPDSILCGLGGQTGLTIGMQLAKDGYLDKMGVTLLGTDAEAIDKAEDRQMFRDTMVKINQPVVPSDIAYTVDHAKEIADEIGYPVIIRPAFTLGGAGGGVAYNEHELEVIAKNGLMLSPITQVLVERYIAGWKEIEFEVMRDSVGNVIAVCSMENFDPVGVHTGDSIVIAPAVTLADKELQMLRSASLDIITELGIEGGCNCQFALNPESFEYSVIEVNPRVSRSSALASKATGYPIAKVTTKIALGYTLDEIKNDITGKTCACFEPTLDYVVVKLPKWPFDKFVNASRKLGTQMKATGEVMSIAPSFEQAIMKAVRGAEIGLDTLNNKALNNADIRQKLHDQDDIRLFTVFKALKEGISIAEIHQITMIDEWFLAKLENLAKFELEIEGKPLSKEQYLKGKKLGYPDKALEKISGGSLAYHRDCVYKMVDTCGAEFKAETPYFYSTYDEHCEARELDKSDKEKIIVLGSGPIRIGQGIEFDYCCVHASLALKKLGFETIIVNCNPETVSTDYDTSDKLYFEPLTLEDVLSIHEKEKPLGVIAQFGGQTPLNLASQLKENGVNILGTTPETIDMAEDRDLFNEMMEKLEIPMPESGMAVTIDDALEIAQRIGYPLMVRPSYVLGGRGMEVVYDDDSLKQYMAAAVGVTPDRPILIDRFLNDAMECEADAISDGENVFVPAVMEHIELAGIHSGDSACILPSKHIPVRHVQTIKEYTKKIAREMNVRGLMNMQYAIADDKVYVLEANPRASRTVPLVSKVCNINMVKLATDIVTRELTGRPSPVKDLKDRKIPHIGVKQAVFPFNMFPEVDPILGPEMRSTGEVLGLANSYGAAIFKAEEATQTKLPTSGRVLISVSDRDKKDVVALARKYYDAGFEIVATGKTFELINSNNIPAIKIKKIKEGRPNIADALTNGELDMVINTPHGKESAHDDSYIRKTAIKMKIPYMTNIAAANAAVEGILEAEIHGTHEVKSLQEYHKAIKD